MKFAEIAVDAPLGQSRLFSYEIPSDLNVAPGNSVMVPFGAQILQGIVFNISDTSLVEKTRQIIELTDPEILIDQQRLEICKWMSKFYFSNLFNSSVLMLPPGSHKRYINWLTINEDSTFSPTSEIQKKIVNEFIETKNIRQDQLIRKFGNRASYSINAMVAKKFLIKTQELNQRSVKEKYIQIPKITALGFLALEQNQLSHNQHKALIEIKENFEKNVPISEFRKKFNSYSINKLIDKSFIELVQKRQFRSPLDGKKNEKKNPVNLSSEQEFAVSQIYEMLDNPQEVPKAILIHGVTGSGKTEVYIESVRHCLELNQNAIILVPEISLTAQIIERFQEHFPDQIGVIHSGLTQSEKFDEWWRIKNGDYRIVIGSRSALFAPMPNLGLIVIDEEHDPSYKESNLSPKYQVKDVAMQMAAKLNLCVVLGSASPDVETYFRAERGRYKLARLDHRFGLNNNLNQSKLADVEVVDMKEELKNGNYSIFSNNLILQMQEKIEKKEQIILFVNRRGTFSLVQCQNCGQVFNCSSCDKTLTYHSESDYLKCHYCGLIRKSFSNCTKCDSASISKYGLGTQLVEDEFKKLFQNVSYVRWDSDVTRNYKEYQNILNTFANGEAKVLIGTQVIAKGHHIPSVTLVGVVNADIGLGLPDFRASERVFQMLCQVAGRSGRGDTPGKVIIQTYQPDHYSIENSSDQNYKNFYSKEISYRKSFMYPPYSKIIRLIKHDINNSSCERDAFSLFKLLKSQQSEWGLDDTDILGPTPAFPSRIKGHYRWQILLRGNRPESLLDTIEFRELPHSMKISKDWSVDVNPLFAN
ncbi:MAG: primosomal protein N' [SAR202 cluster bacterium]|nr:MAG: primosomal protein N' [SAR202 cluster bacterium]